MGVIRALRLLLDTHVFVWLASDRGRLRHDERGAIERYPDNLVVSTVSIWELSLKWRSNPRKARQEGLIKAPQALLFAEQRSIALASLAPSDAADELVTPLPHNDPFDEMLLIHAQRLGARLLTRDKHMLGHPLVYSL